MKKKLLRVLVVIAAVTGVLVVWTRVEVWNAERTVPPLGRFVDVAGSRLHVAEAGSGRPLILIHGLGAQMRTLTWPLMDELSNNFRVVAVDRPGSGYSTRDPELAAGILGGAEAIAELIRELELEDPIVVGHSLGGAVSLALAVNHPELVGELVLLAPLTHLVDEVPSVFEALEIEATLLRSLLSHTVAVPAGRLLRGPLLEEIFAPEPVHPGFGVDAGGVLSHRPSAFRSASADLLAVPQHLPAVEAGYPDISVPVAILYGRGDRILDAEVQGVAVAERIPGATVELVEGGHMLPITQPDVVIDFIQRSTGVSTESP